MKTPQTEAGYTGDMIQYLAMSHPSISFKFINNGQIKIQTSGNGNRKEVIYSIFGRDIAANLCEVDKRQEVVEGVLHLTGFCGKPVISRGNRNLEMYFINGRYIKNAVINQAIEAAYKPYMMTRKYPFTALYLEMPQELVDVNVHPSKMEAQFGNREMIYQMVEGAVSDALRYRELIPEVPAGREVGKNSRGKGSAQGSTQGKERGAEPVGSKESDFGKAVSGDGRSGLEKTVDSGRNIVNGNGFGNERSGQMIKDSSIVRRERPAEPFEKNRLGEERLMARKQLEVLEETLHPEKSWGNAEILGKSSVMGNAQILGNVSILENSRKQENYGQEVQGNSFVKEVSEYKYSKENNNAENIVGSATEAAPEPRQTELFDMPLLSAEAKKQHRIIGQVFSTYWLVEFADKLFIIDQHAAHEKVLYERNVKAFHEKKEVYSQMIAPPAVVSLSQTEQEILKEHLPLLEQLGFEIEPFGGNEYALRAAPADMMNLADEEMFLEVLDALMKGQKTPEFVLEKLATISCKAAVKGGNKLKQQEIEELIDELLTLENPYHCPHGRPTIISMSRYEMEKKFKRIV
jgi:DNA mismatch repair protein MutL